MRTVKIILLLAMCVFARTVSADNRPNILWISCEDISPNLGCYGDPHAITPTLDRLASEGTRFTRAFTPAGVCAIVRSSIITGMYAPTIGSQHMRSEIIPPANVKAFPELLRAAGYFTTNRSKTDYQFNSTPAIWDRQGPKHEDWRERKDPDQPFFSVINFIESHESQIRHGEAKHRKVVETIGSENAHDPNKVGDTIPEYLPNTPATRKNWAWYHDNITLIDKFTGDVLQRLEDDGLTDNTIVIFWGDHGMGLPRGKRWLYDTGTLVPMIVRWPKSVGDDVGEAPGTVREDLVTTVDLAPTMLSLAGVEVPSYMQGRVMMGKNQGEEPPYLFYHRDRMDEVYELQRAARDRRWKYIRNFEPEKPYSQRLEYMDDMPAMQDWRRWAAAGRLSGGMENWFQVPKPIEELYDTNKDPYELNNLADRAEYADRMSRMRAAMEAWQEEIADTGIIPEAVMMEEMKPDGVTPTTENPEMERSDNRVSITCPTDGSSLVYQTKTDDGWSDWTLYTKSFSHDGAVQAQACRLGFSDSEVVTLD
ncbi:sulfatase [Rubripirellula amarantea]|nr:sulfatase [Rubripirellula amarantea]